jgi:hypothetical protein
VPDDLLAALEAAGPEAAQIGAQRARTMLAQAPERAAGCYIVAPFKNPEEVLTLL